MVCFMSATRIFDLIESKSSSSPGSIQKKVACTDDLLTNMMI